MCIRLQNIIFCSICMQKFTLTVLFHYIYNNAHERQNILLFLIKNYAHYATISQCNILIS